MIIVRTPLRISFLGGGTDLPAFCNDHVGAVVSSTIDKYIYVLVKERFDDDIVISCSQTERVAHVDDIQHELVREAMKQTRVSKAIEIDTIADIPSRGSGLGSSSTVTVGLVHALALHARCTYMREPTQWAEAAIAIEINTLGRPIGRQDHYAAAFGGINHLQFSGDRTEVRRLDLPPSFIEELDDHILLFHTGKTRKSVDVLQEQSENAMLHIEQLILMKKQADEAAVALEDLNIAHLGALMQKGWELKKQMASNVTNDEIDAIWAAADEAGAIGGKITGAGGGGFFLVLCPPGRRQRVRRALCKLHELPIKLDPSGSKVVFDCR